MPALPLKSAPAPGAGELFWNKEWLDNLGQIAKLGHQTVGNDEQRLPVLRSDTMRKEYDFSKGVRGKFYRPNAKFNLPIYLDADVQEFVQRIARRKRSDISAVVNRLLKSDMELVEAAR